MTTSPLDPITPNELARAVSILQEHFTGSRLRFKFLDLFEAPKSEVVPYLDAERLGKALPKCPDRRARAYFHKHGENILHKSIINITTSQVVSVQQLPDVVGPVDADEVAAVEKACDNHPDVIALVKKLELPLGARVINDPWGFGTDNASERRRLYQCYMYIVLNDDPEANHYSLPAPFSPVINAFDLSLQWIDWLPISKTPRSGEVAPWTPVPAVEYAASIMGEDQFRQDLKPLQVTQPDGPSFSVSGRQVEWQKWKFTLGWTLREGPVLHNLTYDGRSTFYRLSFSEMTVPYGDPRSPYHRKQAFDLGDAGLGLTSNSLELGCDCLGHIRYFDGYRVTEDGHTVHLPNVVCMHEIDQGIGWKHTNNRNGKASITRNRQLVIQCTATVANYEYIFAFILDQSANVHFELKATGIVSTVPLAEGSEQLSWGTKVSAGALAINHQHLFNLRIDPAIDGHNNTIVYDDVVPVDENKELDPFGVAFKTESTIISKPGGYNMNSDVSRTYRIQNSSVINSLTSKPVSYKLHGIQSQMMIMKPRTFNFKRGIFASKPIWVTKNGDDELWAAGEFTNQSREDTGLAIWSQRDESVEDTDVVLWHTFGLTHVPRPEDFPVMTAETMTVTLKPSNFFTLNPSNDVPRSSQAFNLSTLAKACDDKKSCHS